MTEVESSKKKSKVSVWYNFRRILIDILSKYYISNRLFIEKDFGEKELTLILRNRILMYCIHFLWLLCIGLVFLGVLMFVGFISV